MGQWRVRVIVAAHASGYRVEFIGAIERDRRCVVIGIVFEIVDLRLFCTCSSRGDLLLSSGAGAETFGLSRQAKLR